MKRARRLITVFGGTLCLMSLLSASLSAADRSDPRTGRQPLSAQNISDVSLSEGGVLHGQVVDANAAPNAGAAVLLVQGDVEIARVFSDEAGRFKIDGVRGGMYQLVSGQQVRICRVWASGTAPPSAVGEVSLASGPIVRGRHDGKFGGFSPPYIHPAQWLHHPCTIGALIGGAIAIPIALHDNEATSS